MSFIGSMKDKTRRRDEGNVLHWIYGRQNAGWETRKCPSTRSWRTKQGPITREVSFIKLMKDKMRHQGERNVLHWIYERQNTGWETRKCPSIRLWKTKQGPITREVSFIKLMKDKMRHQGERNVLHWIYERQNTGWETRKCPSIRLWRTKQGPVTREMFFTGLMKDNEVPGWKRYFSLAPCKTKQVPGNQRTSFIIEPIKTKRGPDQ